MKAAVWHARHDIRIEEFPDPGPPAPDEVRLRISWCGICGTDLEEYTQRAAVHPARRTGPTRSPAAMRRWSSATSSSARSSALAAHHRPEDRRPGRRGHVDPLRRVRILQAPPGASVRAARHHGVDDRRRAGRVHQCPALHVLQVRRRPRRRPRRAGRAGVGGGALGPAWPAGGRRDGGNHRRRQHRSADGRGGAGHGRGEDHRAGARRTPPAGGVGPGRECGIDPAAGDPVSAVKRLTGGHGADVVFECAGITATMAMSPGAGRAALAGSSSWACTTHPSPSGWHRWSSASRN